MSQASLKIEKKFFILFDGQKDEKREYTKILRASYNSNVLTREQIQKLSANNIYDLFKGGAIPGVTVNGDKITIRGGSSFDLDNEPLFVVDGTLYESSSEVDGVVSINDIDKVEIQKDGAAYGMKGANGVIVITTIKNRIIHIHYEEQPNTLSPNYMGDTFVSIFTCNAQQIDTVYMNKIASSFKQITNLPQEKYICIQINHIIL